MQSNSQTNHPIEASVRDSRQNEAEARLQLADKVFGLGFGLHLRHERASVACPQIGHLGCLPRHNALMESLTQGDLRLDPQDVFGIEPEFKGPSYQLTEALYNKPLFPK